MRGTLAQYAGGGAETMRDNYGSLVFMGLFFLALILAGIWWLRR